MSESNEQGPEMGDMGAVAGFEESIEAPEITDESIQDFIDHGGELPSYHTILEVWQKILEPAREETSAVVTPQWANRITSSYRELNYADMETYRDLYYAKVVRLLDLLDAEVASDADCLTYTTPEEDAEHNAHHYRSLLHAWQIELLRWELDWRCTDEHAAVEIAALSEVHKMFFSPTGITQYLDNIKFEYTDADREELAVALAELKEGR